MTKLATAEKEFSMTLKRLAFNDFYDQVFLPEHRHPMNVCLHVVGTLAGLAWIALTLAAPGLWKLAVLLFPVIHAAPGIIGHRLLERSAAIGDARWRRTDHAPWMFIVANHRLTFDRLALGLANAVWFKWRAWSSGTATDRRGDAS